MRANLNKRVNWKQKKLKFWLMFSFSLKRQEFHFHGTVCVCFCWLFLAVPLHQIFISVTKRKTLKRVAYSSLLFNIISISGLYIEINEIKQYQFWCAVASTLIIGFVCKNSPRPADIIPVQVISTMNYVPTVSAPGWGSKMPS